MEPDQPPFEEPGHAHHIPSVIVGIADYKSGKDEEEIHGQVSVVDDLVCRSSGIGLEQMECDDQYGCHSSQSVQDFVSRL